MDEITMFAELRPNDTFGDAELAAIRAELFPGLEPTTHLDTPADDASFGELLDFHHTTEDSKRRRRSRVVVAAAAAVVLLGVGGLWVAADRDGESNPLATADQPTAATPTTPTPAQPSTAAVRPADQLLYPTETATDELPQLTVADLNEGQQAMVQAPDGTLYRVGVSEKGGYVPDFAANSRDIGDHQVVANSGGQSVGYSWTDGCVVISVTTGDDGPTWAPERIALLESFTVADGGVGLDLAEGWNVIDHGSNAPFAQLSYAVELDGVAHPVVLAQSIGASIAALGSPMGPMEPVTLVDGTAAWFEPDSPPAPRLSFARDGVAVWIWGDGLTADDLVAAAALLAPAPDAWNSLLTNDAEIAPTGTVPPGGAPDLCGTPKLTIGT